MYWDLPGAVEETAGMAASRGRGGNMKFTLQTIHQKVSSAAQAQPLLVSISYT